jgi:hypothetical protein
MMTRDLTSAGASRTWLGFLRSVRLSRNPHWISFGEISTAYSRFFDYFLMKFTKNTVIKLGFRRSSRWPVTTFSLLIFPQVLGDLESPERQRYISISNRVRTLSFSEPHEPIPRNLINDIIEYNLPLTPRVDVLRLRISSEAGLRLLPALITPELTEISLSFDENLYVFDRPLDLGNLIKAVYMTIFQCAPKLVHFSVVDLHEALPLLSLTQAPGEDHLDVACLQSLTHASFYITATSLPQVLGLTSQLCKLEDLTIQVCGKPFEEIPRLSSLAPETFSSLKSVTFDGSPDIISRIFFAFPANRAIQSAVIRMHGLHTNADIALVLLGVVAAASKESLQKIVMTSVLSNNDLTHWDADSEIDTRQFILDINAIEPALQFQNLEIFSACLGVPLYLTDEDHLRIAQTWRSVRLLYLSSIVQRVIRTHKPPASIASLVHYARYCRHLKALGLCLDASTKASVDACVQAVDAYENISESNLSLPSPSIKMVEFGPSWLECNFDPVQISSLAKAFTRLFSNLAACRACRTEELGAPQAAWTWMKVQTLYEYILFTDQGCNVDTPRSAWKLRLFSKVCSHVVFSRFRIFNCTSSGSRTTETIMGRWPWRHLVHPWKLVLMSTSSFLLWAHLHTLTFALGVTVIRMRKRSIRSCIRRQGTSLRRYAGNMRSCE